MIGRRLGHYEIVEKLGEGGMGEVYRAHDTTLGRDVAVKLLPQTVSQNREKIDRLEREARLLASLNHPHVATLYGLEQANGLKYLVMELVPGETLAARIASRSLAGKECLDVFREIAEALEAAHEKGIVHRDLKPANVIVGLAGRTKVLDFGLAKAVAEEPSNSGLSSSPTRVKEATAQGIIQGTALYMSPEQARGKKVDCRTDIWSFGCMLFEALTGKKAFDGETVSDVIAAVLEKEPDWKAVPENVPSNVRRVLHRCLEKDPRRRLQHIGDARIEIEESQDRPPLAQQTRMPVRVGWIVAAAIFLAGLAIGTLIRSTSTESRERPVSRLTAELPQGEGLTWWNDPSIAISPDGRQLAYVGGLGAERRIYVRPLDGFQSRAIGDTHDPLTVFFSPDGKWLGFYGEGKLSKIDLDSGRPIALCDAPNPYGASWGPREEIVFAPGPQSGLWRISVEGGSPSPASRLDPARDEVSHRWPQVLPDGRSVLFTIVTGKGIQRIGHLSLQTGEHRVLLEGGSFARYVPTGHLIYVSEGGLVAVPFDVDNQKPPGRAVPLLEEVTATSLYGSAHFDFSLDGTFAYVPGGLDAERSLVWVDRSGAARLVTDKRRAYEDPRLSPDGRKIAVTIKEVATHIWLYDLERDALMPLTSGLEEDQAPLWTVDGESVVHRRGLPSSLFWASADGGASPERLTSSTYDQWPGSWTSDGKTLVYWENSAASGFDVGLLKMDGERTVEPLLQTPANEFAGALSPDGRFLAYVSDESGRPEIYVRAFPDLGKKVQVSNEGGRQPVWARDGREIFYRNGHRLMAVAVSTESGFHSDRPAVLFERRFSGPLFRNPQYDVASDGRTFLMVEEEFPTRIHVVLNWFEELENRVPRR
jgi:serine/threonine-protein kinase